MASLGVANFEVSIVSTVASLTCGAGVLVGRPLGDNIREVEAITTCLAVLGSSRAFDVRLKIRELILRVCGNLILMTAWASLYHPIADLFISKAKNIKAIHLVHVETEIGAINTVRQIGELIQEHAPDAVYVVDSASAFPGNPIDVDKWHIDVDYFVSHKGFNGPSGLNFLTVNKKAMEVFNKRKTLLGGWYSSIRTWYDVWVNCPDDSRHCLESFPAPILHAMRAKLDLMNSMGEEKYMKKYEIASRALREGVRAMIEPPGSLIVRGPKCKGCPGCGAPDPNLCKSIDEGRLCSQTMFALGYPERFDWKKFMDIMENRYWIVAPHFGFGDKRRGGYFYSANGVRIGSIREDQHYPRNILALLTATGLALRECGVEGISWSRGIEKAVEVMKVFKDIGYTMYQFPH